MTSVYKNRYLHRRPAQGNETEFSGRAHSSVAPISEALQTWLKALEQKTQSPRLAQLPQLRQLWLNWSQVMGPELANLAIPMGHRGDILIVGGEDSLVLQDLTYSVPDILERANDFLAHLPKPLERAAVAAPTAGGEGQASSAPEALQGTGSENGFFRKVELHLLLGKSPLGVEKPPEQVRVPTWKRPENLGHIGDKLPIDSPVRRSYELYVKFFEEL